MSLKIDRVQLEIVIQQDQARQKMIELEDKMRSANRELKNVKKQFGENSAEYAKQVEVLKKLQQEYDNLPVYFLIIKDSICNIILFVQEKLRKIPFNNFAFSLFLNNVRQAT
jgi:CHAT domain-containing protein